jgi:hypothetical protein
MSPFRTQELGARDDDTGAAIGTSRCRDRRFGARLPALPAAKRGLLNEDPYLFGAGAQEQRLGSRT